MLIEMITSGAIIGLCCYLYQNCINQIVGAFLFGIGLVTICACKLPLFTGRVGGSNDYKELAKIFVLNIIGIFSMRLVFEYLPYYFAMGIGCGMLMQIGVIMYQKGLPYITVMCVGAFILCGFKHCIAMAFNDIVLIQWLQVILGNIVGAKLMHYGGVNNISHLD